MTMMMMMMMNRLPSFLWAANIFFLLGRFFFIPADAFAVVSPVNCSPVKCFQRPTTRLHSKTATLTEETTWKFSLNCYGLPTKQGKRADQLFVLETQFIEEEGYEPPQGCLRQVGTPNEVTEEGTGSSNTSSKIELVSSRWQLSEDPSERKDGLWVWGLFKEPLYPFLLLQMETKEIPLPGSEGDAIKPLKLYAQLTHKRDRDTGCVELGGAPLNVREVETVKADPFGAAKVDIYDEIDVGRLNVTPL
jgi:hypothetical protein